MADRGAITFNAERHEYRLGGFVVPSVTTVLPYFGGGDDLARIRGTYVHEATVLLDEDRLDWEGLDPDLEGYVRAWERYRSEQPATPVAIEEVVHHPRYQYAGTLDRVMTSMDGFTVLDIKTGETTPFVPLQLAAYTAAWNETHEPHCRITKRVAVYLRGNGSYRTETYKARDQALHFSVYLSYLNTYRWEQQHGINQRRR